ncbi:MAG: M23 family metallopeptidase [Anaerolineae bacterium]|nr:M23 family metallopeptidase [Anaerolineae bacterium]
MKHRLTITGLIIILITLLLVPFSTTTAQQTTPSRAIVRTDFQFIRQGRVGVVHVTGADIIEVRAVFQERVHYFYQEGNDFVGLLAADMESDIAPYEMQLWIKYADGTGERIDQDIQVESGEFGRSDVTISQRLVPLLDQKVEDAEMARLFNILNRFTPERYWANSWFIAPSTDEPIGWFGTYRLFNETYWKRHTGVDVRMAIGTPIMAMADGRVMLTEMMDIRGNYTLIDHGWGIYSGYAHQSEFLVVPGQWVRQGDVIGLSGLNGRSAGAHLHWEMSVAGTWIDPETFVEMKLVTPDSTEIVEQP